MGALDGIRVVEAGLLVQGPQAAALLGDWGADVIKVELPGFGDQSRWLPVEKGATQSAYFVGCNRGKRSVVLDLRVPDGRDAFLRLGETADVVISNFKPGTMDEWGLGYEAVAARNPRIIYAASSTFGDKGEAVRREGADLSAQAAGGLISTVGMSGGEPSPVGITIADHIASLNLVAGIVAALFARETSGRGQRIDTSLIGAQIWAQASEYTAYLMTGRVRGPANRGNPLIPGIYGIFPTADGWIALVGVGGRARTVFFDTIGRPELEEQFPDNLYWDDDKAALFPIIDEVLRTKPTAEWSEILGAAGVRHAPVRDHADVVADPSVWENGYLAEVDDPAYPGGTAKVVASAVRFSETPARTSAHAPELGANTEEVLLELGYSWDELEALRAAGAL
jgi:formyl-CoA transferase/CoA:oxalate CoA-transferase